MTSKLLRTLRDSSTARWAVLLFLALPMFASYFFDDIFSTISHIFQHPEMLDLGWSSGDYGFFKGSYSLLCVWGGLVICGMLLDRWGVKVTGSIFVGLMAFGALLITYAVSASFNESSLNQSLLQYFEKPSVWLACIGCALFGLGSEIAGVVVNRSIARWFKGKEMALAMGVQLALARLGTALAMVIMPQVVALQGYIPYSETSKPAYIGISIIMLGLIVWAMFVAMDIKLDKQLSALSENENLQVAKEDRFKFSDVVKVLTNREFVLISLLCVFFYCCIISFRKFATSIIMPRFDIGSETASFMVAMIPFFTLIFAPLFGAMVDRIGKGTKIMVLGSVLVLIAHLTIAFAPGVPVFGFVGIGMLGLGYSLVPAAMWPSIPKIVPEKNLGTAFSLMYWIQNMGMMMVPVFVGKIIDNTRNPINAEYLFIALAVVAIFLAFLLSRVADGKPELGLDDKVLKG